MIFSNQSGVPQMLRRMTLSVFVVALTGMTANAADMPAQSTIGAIFAEPSDIPARADRSSAYSARVIGYTIANGLVARGGYNYGSPYSYFYNGPYYGGPYASDAPRLPYVCGLLGYCF
jgi:hypothetical protein